jgi:hypothetical protein
MPREWHIQLGLRAAHARTQPPVLDPPINPERSCAPVRASATADPPACFFQHVPATASPAPSAVRTSRDTRDTTLMLVALDGGSAGGACLRSVQCGWTPKSEAQRSSHG